ncbi:MAG: rhodanese-like domain-containing protein [Pseudomonadota bacterium]
MAKISVKELVRQANEIVETIDADTALTGQASGNHCLVDIRDIRELHREGTVENSRHVPRGMLEFWFDEASPYHKPYLADDQTKYVLYCASGWRSALSAKTLLDMGFDNIAHVNGGFSALKDAGAKIAAVEKK